MILNGAYKRLHAENFLCIAGDAEHLIQRPMHCGEFNLCFATTPCLPALGSS